MAINFYFSFIKSKLHGTPFKGPISAILKGFNSFEEAHLCNFELGHSTKCNVALMLCVRPRPILNPDQVTKQELNPDQPTAEGFAIRQIDHLAIWAGSSFHSQEVVFCSVLQIVSNQHKIWRGIIILACM